MDFLNRFFLFAVADGFFLAFLVASLILFITHRKLKREQAHKTARDAEIKDLRQHLQLAQLNVQMAKKVTKKPLAVDMTSAQANQQIQNYQKRIDNLEKFKNLYFELESRLGDLTKNDEDLSPLHKLISSQVEEIAELHKKVAAISKGLAMEMELSEGLRNQLQQLETSADQLRKNLTETKHQLSLVNKSEKVRREHYKKQIKILEEAEVNFKNDPLKRADRIKELENNRPAPGNDASRTQEMEELKARLQQREREIHSLRQECETIAAQYEDLAAKSLALAGEKNNFSEAQKNQLEELKKKLEEHEAELVRKNAEYEMLESCYLDLEKSMLAETIAQLQQPASITASASTVNLHDNSQDGSSSVSTDNDVESLQRTVAELNQTLRSLKQANDEIVEQFIHVAQEEDQLRTENEALKLENERLKNNVEKSLLT